MTNEDAITVLKNLASSLHDGTKFLKPEHEQEFRKAYEMAIAALEKQIPKKPVMGYAFGEKLREVIKRTDPERAENKMECCPVCGRTLGVSQFVKAQTGLRFGDLHCKRCGQAIDWENEE